MNRSLIKLWAFSSALITAFPLMIIGCAERTTRHDVAEAREELDQRQRETAEAAREAQREVAEVQREARQDLEAEGERHTVNKPLIEDEAAEHRLRIAEAKRQADEAVGEKLEAEREAAEQLRRAERNFEETRARDAFVSDMEQRLEDLAAQINELEEDAAEVEGDQRDTLHERIEALENQHARATDALEELKNADLEEWRGHQEKVHIAMRDLSAGFNDAQ